MGSLILTGRIPMCHVEFSTAGAPPHTLDFGEVYHG